MTRCFIFTSCFVLALLCATVRIAAATPSVITPPDFKGDCPGVVHFAGTLYPPPGKTTVNYAFAFHDPGQPKDILNPKHTVVAVGSFSATDIGTVTGSGTALMDLFEQDGSGPIQRSPIVTFQVQCNRFSSVDRNGWRFRSFWTNVPLVSANGGPQWDWRINQYSYNGGFGSLPESGLACTSLCAGYRHVTTGGGAPFGYHEIDDWRSYVQFGKIPSPPKPVTQAVLIFTSPQPQDLKCFEGVAPALATWQGNKYWVNGDFNYNAHWIPSAWMLTADPKTNPVMYDVTSIVNDWFSGKLANHGFVLAGSNESGAEPPDNVDCEVNFDVTPQLFVR